MLPSWISNPMRHLKSVSWIAMHAGTHVLEWLAAWLVIIGYFRWIVVRCDYGIPFRTTLHRSSRTTNKLRNKYHTHLNICSPDVKRNMMITIVHRQNSYPSTRISSAYRSIRCDETAHSDFRLWDWRIPLHMLWLHFQRIRPSAGRMKIQSAGYRPLQNNLVQ